jgi:hypothetical protein
MLKIIGNGSRIADLEDLLILEQAAWSIVDEMDDPEELAALDSLIVEQQIPFLMICEDVHQIRIRLEGK